MNEGMNEGMNERVSWNVFDSQSAEKRRVAEKESKQSAGAANGWKAAEEPALRNATLERRGKASGPHSWDSDPWRVEKKKPE